MTRRKLESRQLKAILLQKNVFKIDEDTYAVKSQSGKSTYIVSRDGFD